MNLFKVHSGRMQAFLLAGLLLLPSALASAAGLDLSSPLPVDSKVKMGALPNGMQYWIREHATPPGKVGMWLHIASGSVNEEDDQQGIAHFLEHMAFNGSKNFPPGSLIKFFESLGMRFGADQNAFTSFNQTTYILGLPDTKLEDLDKGLLYFADVAFRLDLSEGEIDKERKVILEESRSRKGARQRMTEILLPILLPGSLAAQRLPIGKDPIIKALKRDRFLHYYRKWYVPGKATLLVVGDLKAEAVEAKIKAHFSDWKPAAKPPQDADPGIKPYTETRAAVITDKEVTVAEVSASTIRAMQPLKTVGDYRTRVIQNLGGWIMNRRYRELIQQGKAPYQGAYTSVSSWLSVCTYITAEARGKPEQWEPMLVALLKEVKRARDFGFLEQELADAKKATLAGAKQAAKTESTRNAHAFLGSMNSSVSEKRKPISAAQSLELLTQLLPGITLEDVSKTFKANFSPEALLFMVTLPEKEGVSVPTKEQILAAAKKAETSEVTALKAKERPKSLLTKEPTPGQVKKQQEDEDLKILSVTLDNGVRAHLRQMDFKKNQVWIQLTMPGGELLETAETRGFGQAASLAFAQKASKSLSSTDIRNLMTGLQVSVGAGVGRDAFTVSISGSPDDLPKGLELAYLLLTEARIEPAALKLWKTRKLQALEQAKSNVSVQRSNAWRALVYGNDLRVAMLTKEQIENITLEKAQAWLDQKLLTAPIEVGVVGDIDRAKALEWVKTYLGGLPKREYDAGKVDKYRKLKWAKGPLIQKVEVDTITPKSLVLLGWRGADATKVEENRGLFMAQRILQARLRDEIREKRGLTYSTGCFNVPGRFYKDTGFLGIVFSADPEKADEAAKLARKIVEDFATGGPTEEELQTSRKQFKVELEKSQQEPSYWLGVLTDLDYRKRKLQDEKEDIEAMSTYALKDLMRVLKKYIRDENYMEVIASPKKKAAPAGQEETAEKPAGEKSPAKKGIAKKVTIKKEAATQEEIIKEKPAAAQK